MEPFAAPAWVVALATATFFGAKAYHMVRGGNGAGTLEHREQTKALQAVTNTLTALTERLRQLPTREDVKDIATESRNDFRNILAAEGGMIRNQVSQAEQNLTRLIEREA